MNIQRMRALLKREILDILRDKKTLIMMIVIPLLLYPLLIVGMSLLMTYIASSQEEKTYLIAFEENIDFVEPLEKIFQNQKEEIGYSLKVEETSDCEKALMEGKIDAYVKMDHDRTYSICYLSAKNRSQTGATALRDAFVIYRDDLREQNIKAEGLDVKHLLNPIQYELSDMSSTEESLGNMIGSMIPFLIITSILLGAIYPAIDVTAGEKERGTLETLLTLPVTNFEMIMSKFLAVSMIACVSAVLNVFSMGAAVLFLVSSSISAVSDLDITIQYESFIPGICFTILVMIFFALFVSAVCMCVCVFAKSFKEANNYATPVLLVFMLGSYVSMVPDLTLTMENGAIPIINVALMIKGLFQFQYDYGLFAIVLFSNVAYSLLTVMVLGKIYNSEQVLFSDGFTSIRLFNKRSEMKKNQMPGYGDIILVLCIVLLAIFYLGTFAQIKLGFGGVVVQQLLIFLVPAVYAWYIRADYKKLFLLNKVKVKFLLGGVLLGVGAYLAAMLLGVVLLPYFPESANNLMDMDKYLEGVKGPVLFMVVAMMPPIAEECLFRGFLMGTLKEKSKAYVAIGVTALIFAAYHMSVIKMFTVGIIGLAFTYAAYKSNSIFTSALMHFLNNGVGVLIMKCPEPMKKLFPILFQDKLSVSDTLLLLACIVVCTALGISLLESKKKVLAQPNELC